MDISFLQLIWFILIAVLIAGYFVLDGFDLGAGVLYPFLAKDEKDKAIVRRSIGPVWDGNEVWLLTAGGALFAAFPPAYATTFSGFYLAVMLVLFGLIVRAVALELRGHDKKWKKLWDGCFFIGSLLPALLLGVAIGNIFAGIPMDANGDYSGLPLIGLITPFTLLCGVLGLAMFLAQGVTWISLKAPQASKLQTRAAKWRAPIQLVALVLFALTTVYALIGIKPDILDGLLLPCIVFALLFVVALAASLFFGRRGNDRASFLGQSCSAVLLVGVFAVSMFPDLVVASAESVGASITAMSAASSELSLTWMAIIVCIGLPLVLLYHVVIYRTFRGRIEDKDLDY